MRGWVQILASGFGVLVIISAAIGVLLGTKNKSQIEQLRGANDDLRKELGDIERRATADQLIAAELVAENSKLKERVRWLETMVTGREAIEGLTAALAAAELARHQEHIDIAEQITNGVAAIVAAVERQAA